MKKYKALCGEGITLTVTSMLEMATKLKEGITADFNGIAIVVNPGDNVDDVVKSYYSETRRRNEEWKKTAELQRIESTKLAQNKLNEAMKRLPSLDFSNHNAVIGWLLEIREPSDHAGVNRPYEEILMVFRDNGFMPNANCGSHFDGNSKENYAGWVIGQALGGLECDVHAIHQTFEKCAHVFLAKFSGS